jgi:hypothetical protein
VRADHDELVFRLRMLPVWKDCDRPVDAIYKEEYDRKMSVLDLSTLSIFKEIDKRLLTLAFRLRHIDDGSKKMNRAYQSAFAKGIYQRSMGIVDSTIGTYRCTMIMPTRHR